MFVLLVAEIGFYYSMRETIVALSYRIPEFDTSQFYLFRPIQLIGYGIYFIVNALVYRFVVLPLADKLTQL
jgi:hypothetical protein